MSPVMAYTLLHMLHTVRPISQEATLNKFFGKGSERMLFLIEQIDSMAKW